jgi:hypothetical protein
MIAGKEGNMGISFNEFHHMGMERYDGGADRWDFDHDGEMSIFEENCRRVHDNMMYEMMTESSDSKSHHWDDDEDLEDELEFMSPEERREALEDAGYDVDDFDDDFGDDFGDDF